MGKTSNADTGETLPEWEDVPDFLGWQAPFWTRLPKYARFWDDNIVEWAITSRRRWITRCNMSTGKTELCLLSYDEREDL